MGPQTMFDEWLTIGLFDPCDDTEEPVATFGTYHAEHDRDRIAWLIEQYNQWAACEPDVLLVAMACTAEQSQHDYG